MFRRGHPPHIPTGTIGFEVFTFYPTNEEFKDFKGYIQKIEAVGAHRRSGICKVVAPEGWTPRPSKAKYDYRDEEVEQFVILSPVKESIQRHNDAILKTNHVYKKSMTAAEFRKLAQSSKYRNPNPSVQGKDIEIRYFENMSNYHPIYGADTEGSFYDEGVKEFNMKQLDTILDDTKNAIDGKIIKGVNSVYLYFGMYGASFAWHVEDMELYSINFLHHGSPKYWFAIPPEASSRFERLMRQQFPAYDRQCKAFMRHKNFMVLPSLLDLHRIPYGTMTQYPNEFIITFPHGYHMGFNLGYNIAESTNFAMDRWIDFGKNATLCKCRSDMVEIDMTPFMRKYRKNSFEKWYSYWYLPKPSKDVTTSSKKRKKRGGTKFINDAYICETKRRRTGCGGIVENTVRSNEERTTCLDCNPRHCLTISSQASQSSQRCWKSCISTLWSNESTNFSAEKLFNQSTALMWPHCAVCQYFQPLHITTSCNRIPQRSARLTFGLCFAKDERRLPAVDITEDELLTCSNCAVSVHPSCYGGRSNLTVTGDWRCLRCRGRNEIAIRGTSCHLCELRGGALVPCRAGADICAYVHTTCAIFNRRTVFNDASNPSCCYTHPPPKQTSVDGIFKYLPKEYVFAVEDDYESSRYQCDLCGHSREGLLRCSACDDDDDPVLAHATCARQAGFLFERRAFPLVTVMICDRHQAADVEPLMDVNLGDIVIAWIDGGSRVQQGRVDRLVLRTFLTIDFEDGSVSENTLPSDIVQCGCIKQHGCADGQHQPGSRVKVRWNDGEIYDGYYRCIAKTTEYTVVFADGNTYCLPRSDLYSANDVVPQEVRRRLRKTE
ncbi:JmjC domain protein [Dictyocaulus viviparus]|uniref:[histone H3]-trimethyl-L-lysine(9) demethylase n=1 Tax=Dictyocaulus viviparus TaxID=29172 RepID=A0A0D8XUH3_DICVI|nr:JmjC domain protein [Dictyocaulus viviparus]